MVDLTELEAAEQTSDKKSVILTQVSVFQQIHQKISNFRKKVGVFKKTKQNAQDGHVFTRLGGVHHI